MSATLIDGKEIANALRSEIARHVQRISTNHGFTPGLAVVLVGEDPASQVYVRNKGVATRKAGMRSIEHRLSTESSEADVVALVRKLNADEAVDGILVQLPLPQHIDANHVINQIAPEKDVDGLTEVNAGRLVLGKKGLEPCTPRGSVMLAKTVAPELAGKHAVVLGRSILVGKPLAMMLLAENCTVTIAHSRTENLPDVCRSADVLCAAVGRAEMVQSDWIKPGAIVIDVGINRVGDKLLGDVNFDEARGRAGAITPVPGGVGPMTIACLLRNTLLAASRRRDIDVPDV